MTVYTNGLIFKLKQLEAHELCSTIDDYDADLIYGKLGFRILPNIYLGVTWTWNVQVTPVAGVTWTWDVQVTPATGVTWTDASVYAGQGACNGKVLFHEQ